MKPEDIKALIDQLMKTGEFLATKSFAIAMKQAINYGIWDLSIGLVSIIIGVLTLVFGYKYDWDEDFYVPMSFICIALGLVTAVCSIRFFVNPEWYAIKMLIDLVR